MASIPRTVGARSRRLPQIDGTMPRLTAIPTGCPFHPRCADSFDRCRRERPDLMPARETEAACWLHAIAEPAHA
jgi:peptide/nickel transport system ATP-binding protein